MKLSKYFAGLIALLVVFSANAFAQDEMKWEDWQNEITRITEKKADAQKNVDAAQGEVNKLKAIKVQAYEDCQDEMYALVGAKKNDVDAYRQAVSELNGKIQRKEAPKADRQAELDALKKNPISALPEFFDQVQNQMQRALDSWTEESKEGSYTVVKGDCLWNIAKKKTVYDNPLAWPKIYQANRDKIKNPDLIFPKQVFKIPSLTEEEVAKYNKLRKHYKPAPPQQAPNK
jgi:nucleoid-associated protein YgaU